MSVHLPLQNIFSLSYAGGIATGAVPGVTSPQFPMARPGFSILPFDPMVAELMGLYQQVQSEHPDLNLALRRDLAVMYGNPGAESLVEVMLAPFALVCAWRTWAMQGTWATFFGFLFRASLGWLCASPQGEVRFGFFEADRLLGQK